MRPVDGTPTTLEEGRARGDLPGERDALEPKDATAGRSRVRRRIRWGTWLPLLGGLTLLWPLARASTGASVSSTPIGVIVLGVLVAVAIHLAVRYARRVMAEGHELQPMRPAVPVRTRSSAAGARRPKPTEGQTTSYERGLAPLPVVVPQVSHLPERRGFSAYVLPPSAVAPPPVGGVAPASAPPPARSGFGWRIAAIYAAIAVPLLGLSPYFLARLSSLFSGRAVPSPSPPAVPYFFAYYDVLVQALGAAIYWPQPWPGPPYFLQPPNALLHTAADYIFTMYLVLMLSFLLASGVFWKGRYTPSQRAKALATVGGYVVAALFTEVFFYAIHPDLFFSSIALVGRAFIGGLFFSFLLFVVLMAPPVVTVRARFARSRADIGVFFLSAAAALTLAFLLLYSVYELLGVGRSETLLSLGGPVGGPLEPIGLLLLMPVTALTFWALIGRALYAYELRLRPVPSLWKYHPMVSVLIPAYNEQGAIGATIRSADRAAAHYPGAVEIIVGNDGSTDGTSAAAWKVVNNLRHAKGKVVDLPHGGKASALNGAIRVAEGEIVLRLDADTRLSPDYGFSEMVPHFADSEVGGVQGLILPLQREGWTRKLRMLEIVWNHLFLRRAFYGTRTAQVVDGAFCAFRRSDIMAAGGWVAWNGEDTEITQRLQRSGFRFRYETRAVAYEDVPANYRQLKKQRVRWTRGGYFAHHRHYPALFSDSPEFGGLAFLLWLAIFVRGGMRHLVYIYAVMLTLLLGLQTVYHLLLVVALLLLPRGLAMAYYLARLNAWSYLPWILTWPITSAVKQFISMEGFGSILPGSMPEFSE